jgi:hypothetical protein
MCIIRRRRRSAFFIVGHERLDAHSSLEGLSNAAGSVRHLRYSVSFSFSSDGTDHRQKSNSESLFLSRLNNGLVFREFEITPRSSPKRDLRRKPPPCGLEACFLRRKCLSYAESLIVEAVLTVTVAVDGYAVGQFYPLEMIFSR